MQPAPQEYLNESKKAYHSEPSEKIENEERIVISGISGIYPQSQNIRELSEILYNKINPIKLSSRWKYKHPEAENYIGEVDGLDLFDAQFFRVNYRLADKIDPMGRKILEQAYQAIFDAGLSPKHLTDKRIGVYIGVNFSDTERTCTFVSHTKNGASLTGCSKPKYGNRISYWLNGNGPSYCVNTACCGSVTCLEHAYNDMSSGRCDVAIVGGCNLCLHPQGSVHYGRIIQLSNDGKLKSFDKNADGIVRSDAINVLFLQKAKDALRIYADVVHVKTEYAAIPTEKTKQEYGFYRDGECYINFLNEFYENIKISPKHVEYVEAFGSGIPKADKTELEVIGKVFCKQRSNPLLVGSVMSNIGYSEGASGISAITKVLLAYHTGLLAGNLNCETPRRDTSDLQENRIRILTDHSPFRRSFVAVNGNSYTGVNSHVLLNGHYKAKDLNRYKCDIPHLIAVSGRNELSVKKILHDLESRPIDPEELALLRNIHEKKISCHLGRGFKILDTDKQNKTISLFESIEYYDDTKRPLWFVYGGMGSQWVGMGNQLMKIPLFVSTLQRCHDVLKPKGLDLINILISTDKTSFDNIIHAFVGIVAIQVALTDVLLELGLVPDNIIGHSLGETVCAYADGCLTLEEVMLTAYARGYVSINTPFIKGAMVAVGIGYKQIVSMCPPEIDVGCHNGPNSCTISGPAALMPKFVSFLNAQGIFTKEVACGDIAYHSRYIAEAGPWMLKALKTVIKEPNLRSGRWISSSVPQKKWQESECKYSSAEYFTNNLLNPVLFEEVLDQIPENALVVEISPHGIMQAILKQSLPKTCENVSFIRRGHNDNTLFLLQNLGRIFNMGFNLKIKNIYPKVEFPVSTGTPFLSHLVDWVHEEKWEVALQHNDNLRIIPSCEFPISIHDKENNYLKGHVINGKIVYPFTGALVAVWDTLAMTLNLQRKYLSVKFYDVNFFLQPELNDKREFKLVVNIQRRSGYFEVLDENIIIVSGFVNTLSEKTTNIDKCKIENTMEPLLTSDNVYQILNERDYSYNEEFCSIYKTNISFTFADIIWNENWVTFLDGLFQLQMLRHRHSTVSQIKYLNSLVIDADKHMKTKTKLNRANVMEAFYYDHQEEIRCGGIILKKPTFRDLQVPIKHYFILKCFVSNEKIDASLNNDLKRNEDYVSMKKKNYEAKNFALDRDHTGTRNSLTWKETLRYPDHDFNLTVHYAGINNYDVGIANGCVVDLSKGKSSLNKKPYGMDFSGVIDRTGERVMGITRSGAVCRQLRAYPELLWPVPLHWSLKEAATVPLPYIQAFYCLGIWYQLRHGNSILVIGGAGGLGQAAISIALAHDCEVFTTVSDTKKKLFFLKMFPQLKDEQIFSSHDSSFGDKIILKTKGIGCNVVINCMSGPLRKAALRCCAKFGINFDVSQVHNQESYNLEMTYLDWDRSYIAVNISSLLNDEKQANLKKLQLLISEGIRRGYVRPLSYVTYAPNNASRGLRLLSERRHCGRVLLDLQKPVRMHQPSLLCSNRYYHWIVSDDEAFGLLWAEKLIYCGARKILINCLFVSLPCNLKIRYWQKLGVQIEISKINMTSNIDKETLTDTMNTNKGLGTMEGLYIILIKAAKKMATLVNSFDEVLRKSFEPTKYFAVVSSDADLQVTMPDRTENELSATFLHIPELKEFKTINSMSKWRGTIDAIEQALLCDKSHITANSVDTKELKKCLSMTYILDVAVPKETDDSFTLRDLRVQYDILQEICYILRQTHNIFLPEEEVAMLTIKKLRSFEQNEPEPHSKRLRGLQSFFSYIDPNELSASAEMMFLKTRTFNYSMGASDFDSEPFLCIIPGLEGHHKRFRDMCGRLKLNAFVLQPSIDKLDETVDEMAKRYALILLNKMKMKSSFYLLGYESGVLTALETAAILEDHGLVGKIFCIGFLPQGFQSYLEEELRNYSTEVLLQNALIQCMLNLLSCSLAETEIISLTSLPWQSKLDLCTNAIKGKVFHTHQYIQEIIEAAYAQIKRARSHIIKKRTLKSTIILLETEEAQNLYLTNKSQHQSRQTIVTYKLHTSLPEAVKNQKCAGIINEHLDSDILEEFENKNICESFKIERL